MKYLLNVLSCFLVALMGAIGGVVNALLSDNGFFLPRRLKVDEQEIIRPGFLGNILIGAVSSFISWALYGPLASVVIASTRNGTATNSGAIVGVTLSSLGGAVLIGIAGSRSQASNPSEKKRVQSLADTMSLASSPSQILRLAEDLPRENAGIGNNS